MNHFVSLERTPRVQSRALFSAKSYELSRVILNLEFHSRGENWVQRVTSRVSSHATYRSVVNRTSCIGLEVERTAHSSADAAGLLMMFRVVVNLPWGVCVRTLAPRI